MAIKLSGVVSRCDRYLCTLPREMCIVRHRLGHLSGCGKCRQGEEREASHGYMVPTDLKSLAKTAAAYAAAVFRHLERDDQDDEESSNPTTSRDA
jgi:hypothetical protein